MTLLRALLAGIAGATVLTILHESARQFVPGAPRVDVIGRRAIARPMRKLGYRPGSASRMYQMALAGELISNSLYYTLVAAGNPRWTWRRAAVLGLAAGVGAAVLPPLLGLGSQPGRRTGVTEPLTILWYVGGALAAAGAAKAMERLEPETAAEAEEEAVTRVIEEPQREPAVVI